MGYFGGLVNFIQFKKREKHREKSDILQKLSLLNGCFSRFLHYTNGTKSCKASHMNIQCVAYP